MGITTGNGIAFLIRIVMKTLHPIFVLQQLMEQTGILKKEKLQTVHTDAGKVLRNGPDVLYAKGCLHLLKFELVCSIAHIVKDVNGQFLVDLALPHLVDQCCHLLRGLHTELGKAHHAHRDAGQVPVRAGDTIKEIAYHLCLVYLSTHDFTSTLCSSVNPLFTISGYKLSG
jgi:hypothetical protein